MMKAKLISIATNKCPRCLQGAVFVDKNPFRLSRMFRMHEQCSHCELRFEPEPAFYYGAMYVSYGYGVALFVAVYLGMRLFYDPPVWHVVVALAVMMLLLLPILLRISRLTYLNLFVRYNPNKRGPLLK